MAPMLRGPARRGKAPNARFAPPKRETMQAEDGAVTGFTAHARHAPRAAARRQRWTNCICVPASSITSPLRSGTESPTSGTPLTLGRVAPSTCAKA